MPMANTSQENRILIDFAKGFTNKLIATKLDVRLFGSIGVYLHCDLEDQGSISEFTCNDIDLVARLDQLLDLHAILSQKFRLEQANVYKNGEQRIYIWENNKKISKPIKIEIYFGQLYFNHLIPPPYFSENTYLLPVTQLLLSKLAIHELTEKDIYSIALLLDHHEIGGGDSPEIINSNTLLHYWTQGAKGWEASHSCLNNLNIVKNRLAIKPELYLVDHKSVCAKIGNLIISFQARKKPVWWQVRDKIGERLKWYREVNYNDA